MEVVWCINHDATAIRSHSKNYPNCVHSVEDIRTFQMQPLMDKVHELRTKDPTCKIALWASLECTNFSKAKNGPKDADSRTLAEDMYRYIALLDPDFFWVENVVEFLEWGPLYPSGNVIPNSKGASYEKWRDTLLNRFNGFSQEVLNSADFGGRTIRTRLFLQFSLDKNLIGTPRKTHSKSGEELPKWLPVKDILDLNNIGKSIFGRKKPLVTNTHRRIYKGLVKFGPSAGTLFGIKYYGQVGFQDMSEPSATLTTKDRVYPVHICLKESYGSSNARSLDKPSPTITKVPKVELVSAFVHNPQYGGSNRSIEAPACTVIARQDKAPLGMTSAVKGGTIPEVTSEDDEWFVKIKEYCVKYGLSDILVRSLTVREMLDIQGFPKWYTLEGTQTEQKKHIGNSVEVKVGVSLFKAIDQKIQCSYAN